MARPQGLLYFMKLGNMNFRQRWVAVNDLVVEQCKPVYEDFEVPIFLSHPAASKANIADKNHIHRLYDLNTWSFYEDISEPIHAGWTVTYVAMQIAYYMGFKRVFLIGVDHSFKQGKFRDLLMKREF